MYITLFSLSFLGATLIPFSSEGTLTLALSLGFNPLFCIIVASLGNCCGVSFNYIFGRRYSKNATKGENWVIKKIFKFDDEKITKYHKKFQTHSILFLLTSWLPIVGDPITAYLGIKRFPFAKFAIYIFSLRILRYIGIYLIYKMAV